MSKPILESKSDLFLDSTIEIVTQEDSLLVQIIRSWDYLEFLSFDTRIFVELGMGEMKE
jgi:hypothetical protein